jgi:ribonuclease R
LGGEYFRFDEARQELRGERTGIRYAIGTRVRVQVSRVDLDGRKIDFRLVREGEDLALRPNKDKEPGKSPLQNFKAAVKKAFTKVGGKSGQPGKGGAAKSGPKKNAGLKNRRSRK